jgi:hypothetical protein
MDFGSLFGGGGGGGNLGMKVAGKGVKMGFGLAGDLKKAAAQKKAYEEEKRFQQVGRGKMVDPQGIHRGEAEAHRAAAGQMQFGATRSLDADVRRGMAGGPRGGAKLATLKILAGQRHKGLQGVEDAISKANIDRQKFDFLQGQAINQAADPITPTMTKGKAWGRFAGEAFGAGSEFSQQKQDASKKKAADVAKAGVE